jgi:hypothetical protein
MRSTDTENATCAGTYSEVLSRTLARATKLSVPFQGMAIALGPDYTKIAGSLPAGDHAGLTSPAWRLSASISLEESPRTTHVFPSSASTETECFEVASMALLGSAIATLKYLNDGAADAPGPIHRVPDGLSGAGMVIWTTQPTGDALPVMHREDGSVRVSVQPSVKVPYFQTDPLPLAGRVAFSWTGRKDLTLPGLFLGRCRE